MKKSSFTCVLIFAALSALSFGNAVSADVLPSFLHPPRNMPKVIRPQNFGYGMEISLTHEGPLQVVELPDSLYENIYYPDLRDVRIFNEAGEPVPQSLWQAADAPTRLLEKRNLKYFPIEGVRDASAQQMEIEVSTSDGKNMKASWRGSKPAIGTQLPEGYLIDLSELVPKDSKDDTLANSAATPKKYLVALDFSLGESVKQSFHKLGIWGSDDLKRWTGLVNGAVLTKMEFNGERLSQTHVDLPPAPYKFLRVDFEDGLPIEFSAIEGSLEATGGMNVALREKTISAERKTDQDGKPYFSAETGGSFPVTAVRALLSVDNTLLKGDLQSASKPEGPWFPVSRMTAFRINIDGKSAETPFAPISVNPEKYWRFLPAQPELLAASTALKLEIQWRPHQLQFLRQEPAPFTLTYGNSDPQLPFLSHEDLTRTIPSASSKSFKPMEAQVGPQKILGGPERLIPVPPVKPILWKKWVLWAVLLVGVALLAAMARRLLKDMK